MSYTPVKLVARRSYSDLGAASDCGPDQQWDAGCNFNGVVGQCVPSGTVGKNPACTYSTGSPGILSQIGSFFGSVLGGAVSKIGGGTPAPVSTPVVVSSTPDWVMPVVIGGGVLAAVMIMKKKKNPARRRRR